MLFIQIFVISQYPSLTTSNYNNVTAIVAEGRAGYLVNDGNKGTGVRMEIRNSACVCRKVVYECLPRAGAPGDRYGAGLSVMSSVRWARPSELINCSYVSLLSLNT